jgi:hypothetical protein
MFWADCLVSEECFEALLAVDIMEHAFTFHDADGDVTEAEI